MAKIKKIVHKEGKPIATVTHYFPHVRVAVLKLSGPLNQGDEIRLTGGTHTDFNQTVDSMQVDHKAVKKAKKGQSVGLKVNEKVREGYRVFRV